LDQSDDDFPFQGDNDYWYTKTGRIYSNDRTRGADLVELVSDVEQATKPDAAPSRSLVERVANAICNVPHDSAAEASAAIREVAKWLRDRYPKSPEAGAVAFNLCQEADRG
jgi:hypothetical protein